jgi:microcystin-dependent protein
MFAGSTAPEGFLVCDGSAVSRSTYSALFDTIGTTYGVGDGSSTFNLPDMAGRVAVGASSTYTLASTGGEETHVLTDQEIPSHTHTVPAHGHANTILATTPSLSHSITQPAYKYTGPNSTVGVSGGGSAKGGSSSVAASRTTNLAVADHAASACTMSGTISDCAAFDTNVTGEDAGHNNMQPYVVMQYIIYAGV